VQEGVQGSGDSESGNSQHQQALDGVEKRLELGVPEVEVLVRRLLHEPRDADRHDGHRETHEREEAVQHDGVGPRQESEHDAERRHEQGHGGRHLEGFLLLVHSDLRVQTGGIVDYGRGMSVARRCPSIACVDS
jgi:hypothetical protein